MKLISFLSPYLLALILTLIIEGALCLLIKKSKDWLKFTCLVNLFTNPLINALYTMLYWFLIKRGLSGKAPLFLLGLELFVCADVAQRVGERRKDSFFEREIALYIVHGILHAAGYDDLCPADRRKMRYHERRLLTKLAEKYDFSDFFQKK